MKSFSWIIVLIMLLGVLAGCAGSNQQGMQGVQVAATPTTATTTDDSGDVDATTTDDSGDADATTTDDGGDADAATTDDGGDADAAAPATGVTIIAATEVPAEMANTPTPTLPPADVSAIEENVTSFIETEGIETEDEPISVYFIDAGYGLAHVPLPDERYQGVVILKQDGEDWNVIAGPQAGGFSFEELEKLGVPESIVNMAVMP